MPKVNTGYIKSEYDKKYHKENYKNVSVAFKHEEAEALEEAAKAAGLTRSMYIKKAVAEKITNEKLGKC